MAADPSAVVIVVGGHDLTPFARVGRVRIDDVLNDAPNTAALSIVMTPRIGPAETGPFAAHAFDHGGFNTVFNHGPVIQPPGGVPVGAPIEIYVGARDPQSQIFGGQIATREQFAEFDHPPHVRYDVTCIDFLRRLNHRQVLADYGQQSATAIVLDVLARFCPGITVAHVQAGLATVTGGITFTWEDPSRALSRIAEKIGAYWYVDYAADLHFFTGTEAGATPAPIVPGGRFADLKITTDLTQVRTRVLVEGDGATALLTMPAGDIVIPIAQTLPFNPSGGRALIGTTRITYTGIHAGGAKTNVTGDRGPGTPGTPDTPGPPPPPSPATPTIALASAGTAGGLAGGPYYYGVTVELADGSRSPMGLGAGPISIAAAAAPGVTTAAFPTTPTKGPIAVGVTCAYATSFVDAQGRETAATLGGNTITGRVVANPAPPWVTQITLNSGGRVVAGWLYYGITFLTPAGETLALTQTATMGAGPSYGTFELAVIATSPDARVMARRLYRSSVGPDAIVVPPWRHVVDIPNNLPNQTYSDKAADAELPTKNLPIWSTATDSGEAAIVTMPTSSDPRVVRRRLYRKDGLGEYRLIAEIPDNTTTTYTDVTIGAGGDLAPTVNAITTGAITVTAIPLGPAGTVRRRVFRTAAGSFEQRELTSIENNTTAAYLDVIPDSGLGGSVLPAQGGPAIPGTPGTESTDPPPVPIGAMSIEVATLAGFPTSGWVAVEAQMIRYTSTSTAGAKSYLHPFASTGPGAVTAAIPVGTVVSASPALVEVSPAPAVTIGDAVQLLAQVDDLPAQAALAAVEGGDGIVEHYIQDRRLSEAGAIARGLAELALFKTVEMRLSYTTHDPATKSGRTVHVALPAPTSITGDFLIQRVTIDDVSIAKNWYPRRTVDASTTRLSFEDVLNRLLMEQT